MMLIFGRSEAEKRMMELASATLTSLRVSHEPMRLGRRHQEEQAVQFALRAQAQQYKALIVTAPKGWYLPGIVAKNTPLPVIAIPVEVASGEPNGIALRKAMAKSAGFPNIATVAIGEKAGGTNAALQAARYIGASDEVVAAALMRHMQNQTDSVAERPVDVTPQS